MGPQSRLDPCRNDTYIHTIALMSLSVQEDCARVLMFRGAEKELKNSTGHSAYQVAIAASYHNLADAIQKFTPEDIGETHALPLPPLGRVQLVRKIA